MDGVARYYVREGRRIIVSTPELAAVMSCEKGLRLESLLDPRPGGDALNPNARRYGRFLGGARVTVSDTRNRTALGMAILAGRTHSAR